MALNYHFDLYPRTDPKDGTRLVRFTNLQSAQFRGEANGTGSGEFTIRADDPEADFIDPLGLQYVRVVRDDGATELVVGGFFLERGEYKALDEDETRLLKFGGAGPLTIFQRAVMDADSWIDDPFIGTDPQPEGVWPLHLAGTGNELGAILWRVLHELEEPGRHQDPLPFTTLGFTHLIDSNAAAWVRTTGDFSAQVSESVLSIVRRLMQLGLYVEVDPDTFEVRAFEPETHRRDRTGVAWATDVVRFQAPSGGDILTGNIKSDATRALEAVVRRNAILTGSADTWLWVNDPGVTVPWEGGYILDDEVGASLLKAGEAQLAARSDAGDVLRLRMRLGDDETNGVYLPFEHVLLDDIVTVHTGTGQWDYNEAEFPVAALTISLRPAGDWDCWADLGSSFLSMAERAFQAQPVGAHTHPPNPKICRDTGTILRETYTRTETGEAGTSEFGPEWEEAPQNDPLLISVDGSSLVVVGPDPSDFMDHGVPLPLAFPINLTWRWFRDGTLTGTPRMEIQLANGFPTETDEYSLTLFDDLFGAALGNASETDSDTDSETVTAGVWYRGHALLTANSVSASFWEDGDPEPGAWMRTATLPTTTMAVPTHLWTRMWPSAAGQTLKVDDIVINSFSTCIHGGPDANSGVGTEPCGKCVAAGNHEHDYVAGGGTAGQVLTKLSGDDWDTIWEDASGGVTDHGALTGLADDDHPQYATNTEFDNHDARHANGGADELNVAGLSGELADPQPPKTHAASHANGGTDEVAVEGLGTAETDTALVLHPDGTGGIEWGTDETGGAGMAGELVTDTIIGDGVEDTFTLSSAPTGSWALVSTNGADLLPSEFAISGGDIVFDVAPVNLAEVLVTFITGGFTAPATDPGDIADPTMATAEDVALKLNALMANLRTAGIIA